jgi:hypothetical protein
VTRLLAAALLALSACAIPGQPAASPSAHTAGCRPGPPLAGVWTPDRLKVLKACQHAVGVVLDVESEPDGDHHIWFAVDQGYGQLLNGKNVFGGRPALLAEIVPQCPLSTNPPDPNTAAECPSSSLAIPAAGEHIAVDGPWVFDVNHGWNEIHPVDSIVRLR